MVNPILYKPNDNTEVRILESFMKQAFFPEERATEAGELFVIFPLSERYNEDNTESVLARRISISRWKSDTFEDLHEIAVTAESLGELIDYVLDK